MLASETYINRSLVFTVCDNKFFVKAKIWKKKLFFISIGCEPETTALSVLDELLVIFTSRNLSDYFGTLHVKVY